MSEILRDDLHDPEFAALYLKEALQENGVDGFLVALRKIIQATEGMSKVAVEAELGRESLYKALSEHGNPQFSTVYKVLTTLGLQFSIEPSTQSHSNQEPISPA